MNIICLTRGQEAIVDDVDFYELSKVKWQAEYNAATRSFYAVRSIPHPQRNNKQTIERMARRIMGLSFGDRRQVDHINHNTLDNRRDNLRIVTARENSENRTNVSDFGPGVYFKKDGKRSRPFQAHAYVAGKKHSLGCYKTKEEAQEARRMFLEKAIV